MEPFHDILALITLAVVAMIALQMRKLNLRLLNGKGPYSSCCGVKVYGDPLKAIVVGSKSYFVYKCPACSGETLLTTQALE